MAALQRVVAAAAVSDRRHARLVGEIVTVGAAIEDDPTNREARRAEALHAAVAPSSHDLDVRPAIVDRRDVGSLAAGNLVGSVEVADPGRDFAAFQSFEV